MKKFTILILAAVFLLTAETLFQVKDSQDRVVLDVSSDGLRVYHEGDTLMVISSSHIRAFIDKNPTKGLARSFSVTTSSSSKGETNVFEISKDATQMREGDQGQQYTDFSPQNIFLGINAGTNTTPQGVSNGRNNIFIGNTSGFSNTVGRNNVFFGQEAGRSNAGGTFDDYFGQQIATGDNNIYIGTQAGMSNSIGYQNVFIGSYSNMAGSAKRSTFVGRFTGHTSRGYDNVFVGTDAARYNTYGDKNVVIGEAAGYRMGESTAAFYNTFVGDRAGFNNTSGSANVFLGNSAGYGETGSNKLYIANSNTATPLIYGDFSASALTVNGTLTATGNTSVGGTYLRIVGDPGTGTTPTNYVYQGGFANSTGKQFAFAINDALWVTSNAWIDGTLNSKGIEASVDEKSGLAANFKGDVNVAGAVSRSSDKIVIDHPLDPESKYFKYSGVNSDQMSNIFHGNAILDRDGKAVVDLPNWFENINSDFRYQLTAIGAPGPNLYISEKINGNSFGIAGGTPDMEVSWQIIALRTDNYAKAYPIRNETEKKDYEKGYYLHPEAYGLPVERGIDYKNKIRMREKEIAE